MQLMGYVEWFQLLKMHSDVSGMFLQGSQVVLYENSKLALRCLKNFFKE